MCLTIKKVSSWFIQENTLKKKICFDLYPLFLMGFFSWSAGQTQCPIILLAMLVVIQTLAQLFGII